MMAFYLQIKLVHVLAVLASGSLFALRGAALLAGQRWAMAAPLRYLSYSIDTVLLTAALMLLTILPRGMFANGWLALKLVLLVVYVVLGSLALKRARSDRARRIAYGAALLTYLYMLGVARTHHPLGWLHWL
ncbi:MAG: SirB2 family protein [Xanthomonadaceae bacterium]|nr:SirB2 family protein [Xanthomonadaceae bacterium]